MEVTEKTIDIKRVLEGKMGDKARYVPKFVVKWLEHIAYQDRCNDFLWKHRDKTGVDWLQECVEYLDMKLRVEGKENLPDKNDGRLYTFVSNHPLGGIDGVALGYIIGRHYDSKLRFLANDLLMNLPAITSLCVPINKTGHQARNLPEMVDACFASDNHMVMFPAGLCSRRINGEIHDLPWTKTFLVKSVEYKRDIVPIHFGGQNSNFFYNLANLCKRLGIKFNIAMLFLVDEMFKNQHKEFTVKIGKPIPWQTFDTSRTPKQWAKWVEDRVYEL